MPTIGVDVGGTKVLGVVVDDAGAVVTEQRVPAPPESGALVAAVLEVVGALRARHGDVDGLGAGFPGLVDREGTLRFAPNLPGVVELPVARLLAEATALPVRVDNDATCALWAEHLQGGARSGRDVLLVTMGTGLGGGLLLDGRLVRGANGFAGEIGHMVVDIDGIPCSCGRRGCWERYASGTALGRQAREAAAAGRCRRLVELAGGDPGRIRGEHVTAGARQGDEDSLALVERFAGWLALGLANLTHALDVERFVIGGGLAEDGDLLLGPTRRAYLERVVAPDHRPPTTIVAAELGEHAGAVGAALLARDARL